MPSNPLFASFRTVSVLTMLSRILGFIRDVIFAQILGAGLATDAFLVAFKLPNLFRRLTAEGALTQAFLPAYSLVRQQTGPDKALILAVEVQAIVLASLCAFILVIELLMGPVISLMAPGFDPESDLFDASVLLANVTMPYLAMISLVALWSALCQAENDFASGAFAPVLLNLCLIGGALIIPYTSRAAGWSEAYWGLPLACAVILAGILQMVFLQLRLRRNGCRPAFSWPGFSVQGSKMWSSFIPAALGAGGMQLNLLVDVILASGLGVGAISWLYYADRLAQLPLGVVGIAMGTALLPRLSALQAEARTDRQAQSGFAQTLADGFAPVLILVLPATAALISLSEVLISGLFGSDAFDAADIAASSSALMAYASGLPAFVGSKLTQPAFYAMNRGRVVMMLSLAGVGLNIIGSLILMHPFGHTGLAMATSAAGWAVFLSHLVMLARSGRLDSRSASVLFRVLIATAVMAGGIYICQYLMAGYELGATSQMVVLVIAGIMIYTAAAFLLKLAPYLLKGAQPVQPEESS